MIVQSYSCLVGLFQIKGLSSSMVSVYSGSSPSTSSTPGHREGGIGMVMSYRGISRDFPRRVDMRRESPWVF